MFEKEAEKKTAAFFYIFFVFCIDIKQKRAYIIIIRQERRPARKSAQLPGRYGSKEKKDESA